MTDKIQVYGVDSAVVAMTKQDFFALAEKRIRDNAGSGFAEWGEGRTVSGGAENAEPINVGLWARYNSSDYANQLMLGLDPSSTTTTVTGVSRIAHSITQINGIHQTILQNTARSGSREGYTLSFPPAPDGTKTYDSATGDVIQHADSAAAFAAETATRKVIISRQDYVFLESWHEKIADKGEVYPLGNVQYGAADYNGIALSTRDDGYTRFGEWDNETTGNYAVWDDLSFEEKDIFLSDPENNIYQDGDDLIQVRYRIRVVEGVGDNLMAKVFTEDLYFAPPTGQVATQGSSVISRASSLYNTGQFIGSSNSINWQIPNTQQGAYCARSDAATQSPWKPSEISHQGLLFAIPIALVQRRNQGAFHPVYNAQGCREWLNPTVIAGDWYQDPLFISSSKLAAFTPSGTSAGQIGYRNTGFIGSTSGRPKDQFYDAIYASDVKDLRMSSRRRPLSEIREEAKRKAIAGEIRGFEGVPFLREFGKAATTITNDDYLNVTDNSIYNIGDLVVFSDTNGIKQEVVVVSKFSTSVVDIDRHVSYTSGTDFAIHEFQKHSQANPTWTDIIGDPARIAATFPNGVEGQWIPVVDSGTNVEYKYNRKILDINDMNGEYTEDDGASWATATSWGADSINNSTVTSAWAPPRVNVIHYETQAHFTSDDVNSKVLDLGGVWAGTFYTPKTYGPELASSLIGKILTSNASVEHTMDVDITRKFISDSGTLLTASGGRFSPTHTAINIGAPTNNSPAVKTLDYLSSDNGVAKLCYAYKEMIYDSGADSGTDFNNIAGTNAQNTMTAGVYYNITSGFLAGYYRCVVKHTSTALNNESYWFKSANGDVYAADGTLVLTIWNGNGWGDDNQFQIVDNQDSFTDDNGNVGVRGTASFDTQYFIDGSN